VIALHALVDNKSTIGRVELEEQKGVEGPKEETKKVGAEKGKGDSMDTDSKGL
jgi:26S proteasome regulatory subunit N8